MRRSFTVVFPFAVLVSAACADSPAAPTLAPAETEAAQIVATGTYDDELLRVAREELPSFAGRLTDAQGRLVVLIADPARSAEANRYAARDLARSDRRKGSVVRMVKYDFVQLYHWADRFAPVMTEQNIIAVDADEERNAVWVGVESASDVRTVRAFARNVGIPDDALVISVQARPESRMSLQNQWGAPLTGLAAGLQIDAASGPGGECSIGFIAVDASGNQGFVTASHCSTQQYYTDNSAQYQPTAESMYLVAREIKDRGEYLCNWPATVKWCRLSDASFFKAQLGVPLMLGKITRTTAYGQGARGSLTVDNANPSFDIGRKATRWDIAVGDRMDKVGRTSGWTRGNVTQACVRLQDFECQYVTTTWSEPGDSGSPIFFESLGTAVLNGILWGGPYGDWNTTWFSPIWGIEGDLGPLTVM